MLGDSRDAVADDVVQELSGQTTNPVIAIAEDGFGIAGVAEVVGVVTFNVNRRTTEKPGFHEFASFDVFPRELQVVTGGNLQIPDLRRSNES